MSTFELLVFTSTKAKHRPAPRCSLSVLRHIISRVPKHFIKTARGKRLADERPVDAAVQRAHEVRAPDRVHRGLHRIFNSSRGHRKLQAHFKQAQPMGPRDVRQFRASRSNEHNKAVVGRDPAANDPNCNL